MGILSKITGKQSQKTVIAQIYGRDVALMAKYYAAHIYNIPEVRTAIETFADIFASIPVYAERIGRDGNITYFENQTARTLTLRANPMQNAVQFRKAVVTRYMLDNNVFIKPIFDANSGQLAEMYILPQSMHEIFVDRSDRDIVKVRFSRTGKVFPLSDLIFLNRFSISGDGMKNDLGLYETVVQALTKQIINAADPNKVKAFLQSKTQGSAINLKNRDKKGTMADLGANMDENIRGISYLDAQWEITPVNWNENDVNRDLMQFVINVVYNYFGITTEIINNKATEIEYQLFVRNKIAPLALQFEQEFTSKLFTPREIEVGNRIEFDTFNLTIGTLSAKAALFNVGLRSGVLNIDDAREMIGLAPLPDGLGQMHRVTGDTMDIKIANERQLAQKDLPQKGQTIPGGGDLDPELVQDVTQVTKQPLLVGQLESLASIIAGFQSGTYTYNQAKNMLQIGVGLTEEEAEKLLDKQK